MYSVSNAFKAAMNDPVQEHKITGTIGSVSFDENNIVDDSFSISNQSTDTSDVVLGSCYIGQLTAEFTGLSIGWSSWIGKVITPSFGLKVGNSWEYVPLGVFKIAKATHTAFGVQITAYDNMTKFDKKFKKSHFMNLSGMYNIIDQLCTDSGVTLGMSQAQIEALPNGDRTGINIYGSKGKKAEFANDITTNRDLLFWVAQTLGCFATMNRAGQLEFRKYNQNVVDVISNEHRLEGATFEDYITHYIGIYMENLDDNTEDYYGYDTTALTQELNETSAEISADQDDIDDLNDDKTEWAEKLAQGQCTQAEYDEAVAAINAQIKAKQKEIKQLTKRLSWLEKALQSGGDDGSDMVLGANPLTMAKNRTTRDSQRREILGALSDISYTPFTASVICGCIYDLGDVIQFSGGLYNSSTDSFGCVMSYTYTHNGGTELEGYGVDPSIVVVREKTQKAVDRANKNAINSKEVFNGYNTPEQEFPVDPKDGDVYVKYKKVRRNLYPLDTTNIKYVYYDIWREQVTHPLNDFDDCFKVITDIEWKSNGYQFDVAGRTYNTLFKIQHVATGSALIKLPITESGTYTCHVKLKYQATDRKQDGIIGFYIISTPSDWAPSSGADTWTAFSWGGGVLNISEEQGSWHEYTFDFAVSDGWANQGYCYLNFVRNGAMYDQHDPQDESGQIEINVKELYFIKKNETSNQFEDVVDKLYNYKENFDETTGQSLGTGTWHELDFINGVDETSWSGLALSDRKIVNLKDYVMRAWYKADPPQVDRDFSQFCVRYTGSPNTGITIAPSGGVDWSNVSVKRADDGTYALKCGGTKQSGVVTYYAYQITGLTSGKRYYFNFAADFGTNAVFGDDTTKSLGVVFNTTGTILTDDYSGEPHSFNENTLYSSFFRNNRKHYYDFDFVATASTMYMCIVLGDLEECTTQLSFTEFVISDSERKYIRKWYLYDTKEKTWLEYRPFGSGDDGGAVTVDSLADLDDVSLNDLQNNQILKYNFSTGKWENSNGGGSGGTGNYPDLTNLPQVNSNTVVGNKTSSELGIMATLTQAQYDALSTAEKNDPNKTYYITDASGGGGGGDVEVISDLADVSFDSLSDGQILKYDATAQKWENANEYSYTLPIATENTLGGIKVGDRLSISGGILSADDQSYSLPIAGANTLGGIKVGQNLSIDNNGVLSATGGGSPSLSDWGWDVLRNTIEWSGGFAPQHRQLVSYITFAKKNAMIGKMVIIQGIKVSASEDGSSFLGTLDFDFHWAYNSTDENENEVVEIGGMLTNFSTTTTYNYLKFELNVIYI